MESSLYSTHCVNAVEVPSTSNRTGALKTVYMTFVVLYVNIPLVMHHLLLIQGTQMDTTDMIVATVEPHLTVIIDNDSRSYE
jgi:hypothetical protein